MSVSREYLRAVSRRQLETMVHNSVYQIEFLRDRLFKLTGCREFGAQDGTCGGCVECFYNTPEIHEKCYAFMIEMHEYTRKKYETEKADVHQKGTNKEI